MSSTVYINGLTIEFNPCFTLRQFFESLKSEAAISLPLKNHRKLLEFKIQGDHVFGLVFTDTEQSSYVTIDLRENRVIAKVEQLDAGNTRHDFNFFRINLETGNGIFSQYRGSGGLLSFTHMLNVLYKAQAKSWVDHLSKADSGETADEEVIAEIKKAYIKSDYLVPHHDFHKELQKFSKVYQFGFSEPKVKEARMRPLAGRVEVVHHRYVLQKDFKHDKVAHVKQIAKDILGFIGSFVRESNITQGIVIGKDHNDEPLEVPIEPDVLAFAKEDYDKVAVDANFTLEGRFSGPFAAKLKTVMQSNKEIMNAQKAVEQGTD